MPSKSRRRRGSCAATTDDGGGGGRDIPVDRGSRDGDDGDERTLRLEPHRDEDENVDDDDDDGGGGGALLLCTERCTCCGC